MPFCFLKRKEELRTFHIFLWGLVGTGLTLVGSALIIIIGLIVHFIRH